MELIEELTREPIPRELAFPEAEYAARLKKVQERMAEQGLHVLLVSNTPNLGYLSGYDTTMPPGYTVGIVPAEGEVALHCSELEAPCALLFSTIKDITVFHWYDAQDTATQLGELLRDRGLDGKRIGLEMGYPETFASGAFDTRSYLRLAELLPNANFVDFFVATLADAHCQGMEAHRLGCQLPPGGREDLAVVQEVQPRFIAG